jgi:hypothetical protein
MIKYTKFLFFIALMALGVCACGTPEITPNENLGTNPPKDTTKAPLPPPPPPVNPPKDSTQTTPTNPVTPTLPTTNTCKVKGKFQSNICGQGRWGAYLIVLEDGTALQPWEIPTTVSTEGIKVEQGREITFSYEVIKRDDRYDTQQMCMAIPLISYDQIQAIRITCISQ